MAKKWAKLAKKPGNATTKQIKEAMEQLQKDRKSLEAERDCSQDQLDEAFLAKAAGEEADASSLEKNLFNLDGQLRAMDSAERLLKEALEAAKERKKQEQIKQLQKELPQLEKEIDQHYKKGVKFLADALWHLAQKFDYSLVSPQYGCDTLARLSHTILKDFRAALGDRRKGETVFRRKQNLGNELSNLTAVHNEPREEKGDVVQV